MIGRREFFTGIILLSEFCGLDFISGSMNPVSASDKRYPVDSIPPGLMDKSDAIIRSRITRFVIKDERRALETVTYAVTIFNKAAQEKFSTLALTYDKFHEIETLEGTIFDATGEEVRELEKADIIDRSYVINFSLYTDSRIKVATLLYDRFPYTIEFTYEMSYDGYLNWPTWYSQTSFYAVEFTQLEVVTSGEQPLRYWCNRDSVRPEIVLDGKKAIYRWEAKNLEQRSRDIYGQDMEDISTIVRIAPSTFSIEGQKGSMMTWKDFGDWFYHLIQSKDLLPESAIHEINSIVHDCKDTVRLVERIYHYMQGRTRYISVQLGIGGWQPFDATYVHERGYGDCKALSNYMVALLKQANIPAYPVLVESGSHPDLLAPEFACNQFNHVIVCVPNSGDTLWLECTSQTIPFAHLGRFVEHRQALLVSPMGGVIVRIPGSTPENNSRLRVMHIDLGGAGNANAKARIIWRGDQQDYARNALKEASPVEQEDWIIKSLEIPNITLSRFEVAEIGTEQSEIALSLDLALPRYASVSGSRFFFQPNAMERSITLPPLVKARLSPIRFTYPYHDIDSTTFTLPNGFNVEVIPAAVHLESSFGSYVSTTTLVSPAIISFTRSLIVTDYSVVPEHYMEYRQFFTNIARADKAQVVLVKSTP